MSRIFISYRRQDSAPYAGRLCDELVRAYGRSSVFMDIDTIKPGEAFADVVVAKIRRAEVFLALIGPGWLNAKDDTGRRRLDLPEDFVRLEIASALAQGIGVIPVLLNGATVPSAKQLPDNLQRLPGLHAFEVTNLRFRRDVDQLIDAIDSRLGALTRLSVAFFRHRFVVGTASALALLLLGIFGKYDWLRQTPPIGVRTNELAEQQSSRPATNTPPNASDPQAHLSATARPGGPSDFAGFRDIDVATLTLKREIDKEGRMRDLLNQSKRPVGTLGLRLEKSAHSVGVYVASLIEDGPAYNAGLRAGDVIDAVDGKPATDLQDIEFSIMSAVPGSTMMLSLHRGQRDLAFPVLVDKMGDADIQELRALITDRAYAINRKVEKAPREASRRTAE